MILFWLKHSSKCQRMQILKEKKRRIKPQANKHIRKMVILVASISSESSMLHIVWKHHFTICVTIANKSGIYRVWTRVFMPPLANRTFVPATKCNFLAATIFDRLFAYICTYQYIDYADGHIMCPLKCNDSIQILMAQKLHTLTYNFQIELISV